MTLRIALALATAAALGAAGCADAEESGSDKDSTAFMDAGIAAPDADTGADALPDSAAPDASADAGGAPDAGDLPDIAPNTGPDAAPDATPDTSLDVLQDAPDTTPPEDVATDTGPPPDCSASPDPFDYTCTSDPASCPDGICLLGMCLGPVIDEDRWADCSDGTCAPCETAQWCPADCDPTPAMTGVKKYDAWDTTITVDIHGFSNQGADLDKLVYGADKGCGGMVGALANWGIVRPCGAEPAGELAPNQVARVEYYGKNPAPWLSAADIAEIDQYPYSGGPYGLQRYALITAKWIRHKLDTTGATHVNVVCHSMGCLVTRMLIENDYEHLASENRIVRWVSSAGVIAGARLARLFDNPAVQDGATALGLELSDFILMNPDWVMDHAAHWDHKLHEGNNPLFGGIAIHHVCGTDPKIQEALGVQLLDLDNPEDLPNDGILHTVDQYFHTQEPQGSFMTADGTVLASTHSYVHVDHMTVPDSDATGLLSTAGLFHRRKVTIRAVEITLIDDLEAEGLDFENQGTPPAELAFETEVRYDPYVKDTWGRNVLVSETKIAQRTPEILIQKQGETTKPDMPIYEAPVFDDMTSLRLDWELLEVDWYPRFGIYEWAFDPHEALVSFHGQVPIEDADIVVENGKVKVIMQVRVHSIY